MGEGSVPKKTNEPVVRVRSADIMCPTIDLISENPASFKIPLGPPQSVKVAGLKYVTSLFVGKFMTWSSRMVTLYPKRIT
jgi:hypothetical protein